VIRHMDRKQQIIPNIYARELVSLMEELGVESVKVLAETGLSKDMLQDPQALLSYEQELQVFSNAATLSPVPDLGIRLGQRYHIYHHGTYGYAIQTSANFDQALRLTCRYSRLTGADYDLNLNVEDDCYRIVVKESLPLIGFHRLTMEELVFSSHNSFSEILSTQFRFKQINFDFAKNECAQQYSELLQCPVLFDQPETELIIDHQLGELPLKAWDPQTSKLCAEQCEKLLQRLKIGEAFADLVREVLIQLPCDQRSAEMVAEHMHVSTRHLRRKLSDESTTFQKVLDEMRCELAKDYLSHTQLPLDEVAQLLGFSETTNFRRAFKKWMTVSPTQYRENPTCH
jgi:AraC-like DNA-binding protein